MHPRLPSYSPTKHHPALPEEMGFWIGDSEGVGEGPVVCGKVLTLRALSNREVATWSTCGLLASLKIDPTDCTDPSAMSTPVFATSPTTSAVLLIMLPVVYPKMERICETRGPNISTIVFNISPKMVKRFMPKKERVSKTSKTIIMVLLSIPPVSLELKNVDVCTGICSIWFEMLLYNKRHKK